MYCSTTLYILCTRACTGRLLQPPAIRLIEKCVHGVDDGRTNWLVAQFQRMRALAQCVTLDHHLAAVRVCAHVSNCYSNYNCARRRSIRVRSLCRTHRMRSLPPSARCSFVRRCHYVCELIFICAHDESRTLIIYIYHIQNTTLEWVYLLALVLCTQIAAHSVRLFLVN